MGDHDDVFRPLATVAERGGRWWWLYASRCDACGQGWLVAQEERQNDVFIIRRLGQATMFRLIEHSEWPDEFDSYETLLVIGLKAGRRVHFVDPADSSLRWTIEDLARERPGIAVSELAVLLNLEVSLANELARMVSEATDVTITFDVQCLAD